MYYNGKYFLSVSRSASVISPRYELRYDELRYDELRYDELRYDELQYCINSMNNSRIFCELLRYFLTNE
ncbi:MAG: hypothetical protein PVF58_11755 [Candidatus Methanofastidiosia archaeon]|jgi:hypothetical protein